MIKRIIVTIFILCLTNSTVIADCVTGYACSIKDLQEKQNIEQKQNTSTTQEDNVLSKQKNDNMNTENDILKQKQKFKPETLKK